MLINVQEKQTKKKSAITKNVDFGVLKKLALIKCGVFGRLFAVDSIFLRFSAFFKEPQPN